jgi:hypothetical protein
MVNAAQQRVNRNVGKLVSRRIDENAGDMSEKTALAERFADLITYTRLHGLDVDAIIEDGHGYSDADFESDQRS